MNKVGKKVSFPGKIVSYSGKKGTEPGKKMGLPGIEKMDLDEGNCIVCADNYWKKPNGYSIADGLRDGSGKPVKRAGKESEW